MPRSDVLNKAKCNVHVCRNFFQPIQVATAHFCGRPPGVVDFQQSFANVSPVDVAFADLCELVVLALKALQIQFSNPSPQLADPVAHASVFPVIADIKLHSNPGRIQLVNELHKLRRRLSRIAIVVV